MQCARQIVPTGALGALALLAAGCGGVPPHSAEELHEALLPEFEDAERSEEQTEMGVYSELNSVQDAEELRAAANLDKPECLDTGKQWSQLDEVRDAEAAVATYGREGEFITHMLLDTTPEAASEAIDTRPAEECRSYEATNEDGTVSSYTVSDIDIDGIGEDSYTFRVETESEGTTVLMYSLVYQGEGYLGMTTVLGPGASEETLADFTAAAQAHEADVLGG